MKPFFIILTAFFTVFANSGYSSTETNFSFEENSSLPMVHLNIVLRAGAMYDPPKKQGLATIASNMLLRGTFKRDKISFMTALDRLGASVDIDVNSEAVVFRASFLSENTKESLDLLTEIFTEPRFAPEELAKLKDEAIGAVLAEKSNDAKWAGRHYLRYLYGDHGYGNPTNGTEKGIRSINHSDVVKYYSNYIGADTLDVFGSGDIETSKVEVWHKRLKERLVSQQPLAKLPAPLAAPIIADGVRLMIIDKPGATQSHVFIGHQAPRPNEELFYPLSLGNHAYGGPTFQARLMQELRVKRGWTYGASNRIHLGSQRKHYTTYFFPKTQDTAPALKLVLEMFSDLVSRGITPEEFVFAKNALVNSAPFALDTARKRLENKTTEWIFDLGNGFFENYAARIKSVGLADVQPSLSKYFSPSRVTIAVLGDKSKIEKELRSLAHFGEFKAVGL